MGDPCSTSNVWVLAIYNIFFRDSHPRYIYNVGDLYPHNNIVTLVTWAWAGTDSMDW